MTGLLNRKPILAALLLLLLAPFGLFAQDAKPAAKAPTADQLAGSYKGSAKDPAGAIALTLEIKSENGKISGRLIAPKSEQPFSSAELVDGKLTAKLGSGDSAGTLVLQWRDKKLVGDWKSGAQTRAVEFERPAVVVSTTGTAQMPAGPEVKKTGDAGAADSLSGDWDAAADVQGQAFPFALTLKVDGEKVTGSSSSQLGESTISTGTFKDGKLAVVLEGANGQVALIGTIVDGKLVGDFDYAGQLQGKWVATKKKP
jgi:hypothetical protein